MKRMNKRLAACIAALTLLVCCAVPAFAAEWIDLKRTGSIKVSLYDTETSELVSGGELTLYRVAEVHESNGDLSFSYTNGFENCGVELGDLSESENYIYDVDAMPKVGTATHKTPGNADDPGDSGKTGYARVAGKKNKLGNLLIFLGIIAILAAAGLFGYNEWDNARAEKAADTVLTQLEESVGSPKTILPGQTTSTSSEDEETEMPVTFIDGYEYIGYLSIPSIGLALPVMKQWSYAGLKIAPGRYSGSLYTDDLVIAGHNYNRHFSPLCPDRQGRILKKR